MQLVRGEPGMKTQEGDVRVANTNHSVASSRPKIQKHLSSRPQFSSLRTPLRQLLFHQVESFPVAFLSPALGGLFVSLHFLVACQDLPLWSLSSMGCGHLVLFSPTRGKETSWRWKAVKKSSPDCAECPSASRAEVSLCRGVPAPECPSASRPGVSLRRGVPPPSVPTLLLCCQVRFQKAPTRNLRLRGWGRTGVTLEFTKLGGFLYCSKSEVRHLFKKKKLLMPILQGSCIR